MTDTDDRTPESGDDFAAPSPTPPAKPRSRLVYALDIVLVRLRFIGLLILVLILAAWWDDIVARVERWTHPSGDATHAAASDVEYFCPMHPHIVRAEPGSCPICGMPLSRRKKGEKTELPDGVIARVQFSPYRIAQGGIRTTRVSWVPLVREVETVGFVEYDERRLARITARFPGRIESLAVDFTGIAVERGRPLATVYSPELLAAQESLLAALRTQRDADAATPRDEAVAARAASIAETARARLALWGLWPEQVAAIEASGRASPTVEVLAPLTGVVTKKSVVVGDYVAEGGLLFDVADLSTVWVKARVYEDDLSSVRAGAKVVATTAAYPGETFEGAVVFVDPFLDRATRTADLRVDLPNPDGRLLPGMYVVASVRVPLVEVEPFRTMRRPVPPSDAEPREVEGVPFERTGHAAPEPADPQVRIVYWCPMHPEVVQDEPGECAKCGGMTLVRKEVPVGPGPSDVLAVPESAVVDTGRRKVVYVESSPGVFDAHEVVVGPRTGPWYPVIRGVEAGMRVATAGSFLIDAETRLNPAAAGSYFGASGTPPSKPAPGEAPK